MLFGQALKDMGVQVLATATNHSLDKNYDGLERTLSLLDTLNISHVGTNRSQEEQDKIVIKNVRGINIAFLSYTYGSNVGIPDDRPYCLNIINRDKIVEDIKKAKEKKADFICIDLHLGESKNTVPNNEQAELQEFLLKNGADIIIGSEPNVIQPIDQRLITTVNTQEKGVVTAYSLGNFIAGYDGGDTNLSILLNIEITKEDHQCYISKISYRPLYILDKKTQKNRFVVLDILDSINEYQMKKAGAVDEETYYKLIEALNKAKELTGIY